MADYLAHTRRRHCVPRSKNPGGYSDAELKKILTKKECRLFDRWFVGQTAVLDRRGKVLVYAYDLLRFIAMIRDGISTEWD